MIYLRKNIIEEHEELAEKAIWLMGLLGVIALMSLYAMIKNLSFAKTITLSTLIISLATFGLFAKVGNLGGQIRHSEIRSDNSGSQGDNDGIIKYDDDDD